MAKTHHNNGGGVFTSERKMALEPKLATKHPLCQSKTEANQAKRLANQQEEDNHENGKKQFIYAMNIKSNGKSRLICNRPQSSLQYAMDMRFSLRANSGRLLS